MNENKPKFSNAFIVIPALTLILCGCGVALSDYALTGVIVVSIGLLAIAWAMLTGKLKLFG